MQNLELKSRCPDLAQARRLCEKLGAGFQWSKQQIDSYFTVPNSKLKLRQVENTPGELIAYQRPLEAAAKISDYIIYRTTDAETLKQVLSVAPGLEIEIIKQRDLYLWHNVRIHLDSVMGLGDFIEFEAVLNENNGYEVSQQRVEFLINHFHIQKDQLVDIGYYELAKGVSNASRTQGVSRQQQS